MLSLKDIRTKLKNALSERRYWRKARAVGEKPRKSPSRIRIPRITANLLVYAGVFAAGVLIATLAAILISHRGQGQYRHGSKSDPEVINFIPDTANPGDEGIRIVDVPSGMHVVGYEDGYVEHGDTGIVEFVSSTADGSSGAALSGTAAEMPHTINFVDSVVDAMEARIPFQFISDVFVDYSYERAVSVNTGVLSSRDILSNHYRATGETLIMGTTDITLGQMVAYYNDKSRGYPSFYADTDAPTIEAFCQIYIDECTAEGVRYDIAFCQAMKETGFLHYGGSVSIKQFNFAGMGASGGGKHGITYGSVREGIRAHVQHLKAFASTADMVNPPVDDRWSKVRRGSAVYVEYLGINENPKHTGWATATRYGYSLMEDYVAVLARY